MWIEEKKNGFKFCDRYTDPITGKDKKVSVTMPKKDRVSQRLAREKLDEKIRTALEHRQEYLVKEDDLTFEELVNLYRTYQKTAVTDQTYKRNVSTGNTMIRLLGGDTLVARLNAGYVRERFSSDTSSPTTLNERYARFKALMRWAYQNDYVESIQFLDKLKHIKDVKKKERQEVKFLEASELKLLLRHMEEYPTWRNLAEFMALSGLRCGEALALTLDDVDLSEKLIRVNKTYHVSTGSVGLPKTAESVREVYMQPELYQLCKRLKKATMERYMEYAVRTNLLFSDANGEYLSFYSFNKFLGHASERCLGRKVTSHILRHTHVSLLATEGYPLEAISRRLGHAHSQVTKDVYLHVTQNQKEKDNALMESISLLG